MSPSIPVVFWLSTSVDCDWKSICRHNCALKHVADPSNPKIFTALSIPEVWVSGAIVSDADRSIAPAPAVRSCQKKPRQA